MPSVSLSVTVDTIACNKAGCSTSPPNMVATNVYRKPDGSLAIGGQRLPDNWVRMVKMNADGSESAFKVYCPTCAAGL